MFLESYESLRSLFYNEKCFHNFGLDVWEKLAKMVRWSKLELKVNFEVVHLE